MNHWAKLSIELANQRDYLDQLFKVYPLVPEVIRDVDPKKLKKIENAFKSKEKKKLLDELLGLKLFPIKDSYVAYLKKDRASVDRNPGTVNRLVSRFYDMGLEEIWKRASEPKETNRQIGPLFRRWLHQGSLGVEILPKDNVIKSKQNSVLEGTDSTLKAFAKEHLNYKNNKGLDFIAKFNNKYVIGEAKFLTAFGGHQDRQLADAISLLTTDDVDAIKIAILDGVYIFPIKAVCTGY